MYDKKYYHKYKRLRRKIRIRFTLDLLEVSRDKPLRFLDLGCGDGTYSAALKKTGHKVVAVDASAEALHLARQRGITNCVLASATHLPTKSNIFDRILLIDVFEHLREPMKTLSEIYRTLRPNGFVVLQTPNKSSVITIFLKDSTHLKIYTSEEVRQLLRSARFKKVHITLTSFLSRMYPLNTILRHLFKSIIVATAQK